MVLDPTDPYGGEDAYAQWARGLIGAPSPYPPDLGVSTLGPRGTGSTIDPIPPPPPPQPTDGGGTRKGGSPSHDTQRVGPTLTQGDELPQSGPLPDAATDTSDPRGDMTPDELRGAAPDAATDANAPAPPSPGAIADTATDAYQHMRRAFGLDPQLGEVTTPETNEVATEARPDPTSPTYPEWAQQHADAAAAAQTASNAQLGGSPFNESGASFQGLPGTESDKGKAASYAAEAEKLSKMTPAQTADWLVRRDQLAKQKVGELQNQQAKERQDLIDQQRRAEQRAYEWTQAQSAQAWAEGQALAKTKVVAPQMSGANVVGIILGNMFSGGGPNQALEQWNRSADRDIEIQKANIVNGWKGLDAKRTLIGDIFNRTGSHLQSEYTYRVAQQQAQMDELATQMQSYDPQGSTFAALAQAHAQLAAQQVKTQEENDKALWDLNYKKAQAAEANANAAKAKAEGDKLRASIAGGGAAKLKPEDVVSPEELAQIKQQTGITFAPGTDRKAINARLATLKAGAEGDKAQTDAQATLNAGYINNPTTGAPLEDPKRAGQPLVYPPDKAGEINKEVTATQVAINDLSAARRMIAADPSSFDRKAFAKLRVRLNQSLPALASIYGEKYGAKTEGALKDMLNVNFDGYVSRLKDRGPGIASLDETIDTLIDDGNTKLGGALGYDPQKHPIFFDTSRPPPAPDKPEDVSVKSLSESGASEWTDEDHAIQKWRQGGGGSEAARRNTAQRIHNDYGVDVNSKDFKADLARVEKTNVPISKLRKLDELKAQALTGKPAERSTAIIALARIRDDDGPAADEATHALADITTALSKLTDATEDQVFGAGSDGR